MSAHTPGPWSIRRARLGGDVGIAADGFSGPIAEVFEELNRRDLRPETALANATLISAAPDLLAAIEQLHEATSAIVGIARLDMPGETADMMKRLRNLKAMGDKAVEAFDAGRAAIAKARGK